jgi:hypothetical protein
MPDLQLEQAPSNMLQHAACHATARHEPNTTHRYVDAHTYARQTRAYMLTSSLGCVYVCMRVCMYACMYVYQGKETPYKRMPNPRTQEDYRGSPNPYARGGMAPKNQATVHL